MISYLSKKIINILILIILGIQCYIYLFNQKPLTKNFSQKTITVENFSSIVLMNKYSITSLIVAKQNKPIGIVNIKKCLEND